MKFTGRIIALSIILFLLLFIRVVTISHFGNVPHSFPLPGLIALVLAWLLGKQYDKAIFNSRRDDLTGLYNRRFVNNIYPNLVKTINRKSESMALFVIDVNDFKYINDTFGHERGDQVLQSISNVLLKCSNKNDVVARWGGDEFLILSPFIDKELSISMKIRINKEFIKLTNQMSIPISASIGISLYPDDGNDLHRLFESADQNMYHVKLTDKRYIMPL